MPSWWFSDEKCELNMALGASSELTIEAVRLALGASALRHEVITTNIANVSTPDYVRMKVSFDEQLASALAGAQASGMGAAEQLAGLRPTVEAAPEGGKVQIDTEMTAMSENSLRYHALTRGLSRYFSILDAIVSGGRG